MIPIVHGSEERPSISTATPAIAYAQLGTGLAAADAIGYDSTNNLAYVGTAEGAIYAVSIP